MDFEVEVKHDGSFTEKEIIDHFESIKDEVVMEFPEPLRSHIRNCLNIKLTIKGQGE